MPAFGRAFVFTRKIRRLFSQVPLFDLGVGSNGVNY